MSENNMNNQTCSASSLCRRNTCENCPDREIVKRTAPRFVECPTCKGKGVIRDDKNNSDHRD
jgi:DnaJ-class molecular chaperone